MIRQSTIANYSKHAERFWQFTKDHDVSQNIHALLAPLPKGKSLSILDLGCGPGRDLQTFKALGHKVVGLDGCPEFCEMARIHSGCEVVNQTFSSMYLGLNQFHGIYANASLFHVPKVHLIDVLRRCRRALKSNGVLFMSNPRGAFDGMRAGRYRHLMELDKVAFYLEQADFTLLSHYYRPKGKPRYAQPWLALVAKAN